MLSQSEGTSPRVSPALASTLGNAGSTERHGMGAWGVASRPRDVVSEGAGDTTDSPEDGRLARDDRIVSPRRAAGQPASAPSAAHRSPRSAAADRNPRSGAVR